MMTDQQKLNSILRLRLFRSTEKELSSLIGYKLKTNHFGRVEFTDNAQVRRHISPLNSRVQIYEECLLRVLCT